MKFTTVDILCAHDDNPYHVLALDNARGEIIQKRLQDSAIGNLHTPLVYCGLVNNVHFFGRSFIYSHLGEVVFHCQSYQNHKAFNLLESIDHFIHGRGETLFTETLGEECIFLGGMNLEMTPNGPSYALPGAANFGHFIFEYLNRLAIFDMLGLLHLPVVLYECLPPRYVAWLKLLGVKKIIFIPPHGGPAFKRVWTSSAPHYRGTDGHFRFWGAGLHWLRQMVFKAVGEPTIRPRKLVYLGRTTATHRRVKNEAEVMAALGVLGFVFPDTENISPSAQIHTIKSADIIVSVAGANTILSHFAPEHATIITLYPRNMGLGPWGGLGAAVFLRQVHERIECEAVDVPGLYRANSAGVNELSDIIVPLDELLLKIGMAQAQIGTGVCDDALRL